MPNGDAAQEKPARSDDLGAARAGNDGATGGVDQIDSYDTDVNLEDADVPADDGVRGRMPLSDGSG